MLVCLGARLLIYWYACMFGGVCRRGVVAVKALMIRVKDVCASVRHAAEWDDWKEQEGEKGRESLGFL